DASQPTTASSTYSEPISVTVAQTVKAMAVAPGLTNSAIASATFAVGDTNPVAPTPTVRSATRKLIPAQTPHGNGAARATQHRSLKRAVSATNKARVVHNLHKSHAKCTAPAPCIQLASGIALVRAKGLKMVALHLIQCVSHPETRVKCGDSCFPQRIWLVLATR